MSEWFLSLLAGGIGGAVATFLAKSWIEARVISSIQHEYDQRLEKYKKVELVAELFAEWIAIPKGEVVPKERRTRMNQLSFAAAIWLPPSLVVQMSKVLQNKPDALSYFNVLLLARKELLGDEALTPEHITYWGADLEKRGQPVIHQAKQ